MTKKYSKFESMDFIAHEGTSNQAIVLLHGFGANFEDLYPLHGVAPEYSWFFPNGIQNLAQMFMFDARAWFEIDPEALARATMENSLEAFFGRNPKGLGDSLDILERWLKSLQSTYEKVIIGGFSQGGMIASNLLLTGRITPNALITMSSAPVNVEQWKIEELKGKHAVPIFQSHGTADPVLPLHAGKKLREYFELTGWPLEYHEFQGQHEIPVDVVQHMGDFIRKGMD